MFSSPGIRRRSLQVVRRDGALDPEGGRAYSGGMNVEEKALSTFRTEPWRHNCAQAVCAALGREDLLEAVSACGTGRAPDGVCGALYGALLVHARAVKGGAEAAVCGEAGLFPLQGAEKRRLRSVPGLRCLRGVYGF